MNRRIAATLAALSMVALAKSVAAQSRPLTFVRDTSYNMGARGFPRYTMVLAGRDGRFIFAPDNWNGVIGTFDSAFKKLPLTFPIGRASEVAYFTQWGWVGDSVWIMDPFLKQIVIFSNAGVVTKSIGFPSWVRPFWQDRRKYPLFANMTWYGVYPDATMLVEPAQPRHLLDTPGYDATQRMLVRVDGDGRILNLVAQRPRMDGALQLRSGTEKKTVNIPNYPKSLWSASSDGRRVAVVLPIPSDSGAFRVTMVNENGDTAFSRRYTVDALRFSKARLDSIVAVHKEFGRYSAEQMRDTVRKLMPAFYSPVQNVEVGLDYSVWVSVRRPTTKIDEADWFVVDAKGEPMGIVTLARNAKIVARDMNKVWMSQVDRGKGSSLMIRYVPKGATATRPSRSARAGASSQPARPQE